MNLTNPTTRPCKTCRCLPAITSSDECRMCKADTEWLESLNATRKPLEPAGVPRMCGEYGH